MEKHESMLQSELCLQTCVYDELKSAGNCKENLCGALCGKHLSWACLSARSLCRARLCRSNGSKGVLHRCLHG